MGKREGDRVRGSWWEVGTRKPEGSAESWMELRLEGGKEKGSWRWGA